MFENGCPKRSQNRQTAVKNEVQKTTDKNIKNKTKKIPRPGRLPGDQNHQET